MYNNLIRKSLQANITPLEAIRNICFPDLNETLFQWPLIVLLSVCVICSDQLQKGSEGRYAQERNYDNNKKSLHFHIFTEESN
jgi:hypothetical protein